MASWKVAPAKRARSFSLEADRNSVRLDIVRANEELAVFDLVIDRGQRALRGSGLAIAVRLKCAAVTRADKQLASAFPSDLAARVRACRREHAECVWLVALAKDPDGSRFRRDLVFGGRDGKEFPFSERQTVDRGDCLKRRHD